MTKRTIRVFNDAAELAHAAALAIADTARASIAARRRFALALAGGSTPEKTYELLAAGDAKTTLDWSATYLFFGDERYVPHDDPRSNYHMVHAALLERADIPATHVFAVDTDLDTIDAAALDYDETIQQFFDIAESRQPPVFDLILLGLGDDGHTASLFPGAEALEENDVWVTISPPGVLPPPVNRVTFTYPVLNAARQVFFLVAGANKAEALQDVLERNAPPARRPAAGVQPTAGSVTWFVDQAAARLLTSKS